MVNASVKTITLCYKNITEDNMIHHRKRACILAAGILKHMLKIPKPPKVN